MSIAVMNPEISIESGIYLAIKVSGRFCAKIGINKCRASRDFLNSHVQVQWVR